MRSVTMGLLLSPYNIIVFKSMLDETQQMTEKAKWMREWNARIVGITSATLAGLCCTMHTYVSFIEKYTLPFIHKLLEDLRPVWSERLWEFNFELALFCPTEMPPTEWFHFILFLDTFLSLQITYFTFELYTCFYDVVFHVSSSLTLDSCQNWWWETRWTELGRTRASSIHLTHATHHTGHS